MQLSTFDLNLLRALDTLLQERSVTRAAERLHVTQQSMSGTLKRLREQFDDELLVQVGRRLEPTSLGSALIKPVRDVILHITRVVETQPTFDAKRSTRRFCLSLSDYANLIVAPPLMAALSRQAPDVVCDFRPLGDMMFRDLDLGMLDFGLLPSRWQLYQDRLPDGIRSTVLFEDDFVCVVDRDNPVGDVITIAEYASLPHLAMWVGPDVRTIVANAWTINRLVPKVSATSTTFTSLVSMVVGTPMVATVQRRLARRYESCWPIRILECPIQIEPVVEHLSWHERNLEEPAHRFMRDCFAEVAAALGGRQPRS